MRWVSGKGDREREREKRLKSSLGTKKWDKLGQLLVTFRAPYILSTKYRYLVGDRVIRRAHARQHIFHARLNRLKGAESPPPASWDKRGERIRRSHFEYYHGDDDEG